jgi:putative flippase GtrA
MRKLLPELLGYGLASTAAFAVDVSTLEVLVKLAGWHYLPAASLAFIAGGIVAYLLSVRFVFRFRQIRSGALEFSCFVALGVVGLVVNAAMMFIAISGAGLELFAAKLLAAACTFATNFVLRRQVLFAPARSR